LVSFEQLVGGEGKGAVYWADLVGLGHRMNVRAGSLSGGERRLLEVARSLVARPRVLICDEPFSGIDPVGAMRVAETLRLRAGEGLAVLLSDHHASIALRVCDEAGMMCKLVATARAAGATMVDVHARNDARAGGLGNGAWGRHFVSRWR
jgi:ABC-type multidrug transport system ATPase subunit